MTGEERENLQAAVEASCGSDIRALGAPTGEVAQDADQTEETVSFTFSIFLRGGGPYCGAPINAGWCHFADVDDLPGDSSIPGETGCKAKRYGPLQHITDGYSVSLLDAADDVVAVTELATGPGAYDGLGHTDYDPEGQPACHIEVAFTNVPTDEFYSVRTEDGQVDFALTAVLDEEREGGAALVIRPNR